MSSFDEPFVSSLFYCLFRCLCHKHKQGRRREQVGKKTGQNGDGLYPPLVVAGSNFEWTIRYFTWLSTVPSGRFRGNTVMNFTAYFSFINNATNTIHIHVSQIYLLLYFSDKIQASQPLSALLHERTQNHYIYRIQ